MELAVVLTPTEDGGFIVRHPLSGAIARGDTLREALCNLREATELYSPDFWRLNKPAS